MVETTSETAPAGPRQRSRSITLYLFILALVALLPAFIFTAVLLQRHGEAQEQVVETLIVGTSRSIVQAVEREIVANITTLRVLASAPSLLRGDYEGFYARTSAALEGTGTYVYLLDQNLMSLMNTRVSFGADPGLSADQSAGMRALETGDIVVSDLVFDTNLQRWVFNILLPLREPGMPPTLLGFGRIAEDLSAALLSNKLPDGWSVALIDADGIVIAASPGAGKSGDHFALASPANLASSSGWANLNDQRYQAVVQRSPLSGWSLVAWAPRELIARPLANAFWSLLVGGVLMAALVVLVIYWVSLQIGRSVHGLQADAQRLGAGEPVRPRHYPITEIANVSAAIGDASLQRQAAETEVRFLLRELAHRSKNQMTVIAAMAKQTARGAESVPEFVQSFEKRIYGLGSSTDLLLAHGIVGVELRELLTRQIDPFCPPDGDRVTLEGPSIRLNTQGGQIIGMAGHELATNAVKYGAFASANGTLAVTWTVHDDRLSLVWRETTPAMPAPAVRRGFGTTVLENMVGRSLGARVERLVHPDGIEWRFDIPLAAIDPRAAPHGWSDTGTEATAAARRAPGSEK